MNHRRIGAVLAAAAIGGLSACGSPSPKAAPPDNVATYRRSLGAANLTDTSTDAEIRSVASGLCANSFADMQGLIRGLRSIYSTPSALQQAITKKESMAHAFCPDRERSIDAASTDYEQPTTTSTLPPATYKIEWDKNGCETDDVGYAHAHGTITNTGSYTVSFTIAAVYIGTDQVRLADSRTYLSNVLAGQTARWSVILGEVGSAPGRCELAGVEMR